MTDIAVHVQVPGLLLLGCDGMSPGNLFQTCQWSFHPEGSQSQKNGVFNRTAEKTLRLAHKRHFIMAAPDNK